MFSFLASTSLGMMPSESKAAVEILDVRTGLHPDKTRLVVEVSEAIFYQVTYTDVAGLQNDLSSVREITITLQETPGPDEVTALTRNIEAVGLVRDVTVEEHSGSTRLRISLRKSAAVDKSFTLRPDHGKQYRLVFDLKAISGAEWGRLVKRSLPAPVSSGELSSPATGGPDVTLIPDAALDSDLPQKSISALVEESGPEKNPETDPEVDPGSNPARNLDLAPDSETSESASVESSEDFDLESYDEAVTESSPLSLSGHVEMEGRLFPQSSPRGGEDWTISFALEPLLEYASADGGSQFSFRPFGRVDVQDSARSHFDIRELKWTGTQGPWQVSVGIDTVFWGVTESIHLVNILNQDDVLEDIDQEDKLGQPMASVAYDSDFGVFSAYAMTYFRERRFPGVQGRLGLPLPVDDSQTQYEAESGKWHADWAVRWSHVIQNVDVGLYHFRGTSREPVLIQGTDGTGRAVLIPRYNLINQTGVDLQATFEGLLIKFEAIRRGGTGEDYWAMAGGFEYTFYGLGGGDSDISLLSEYLYDDRSIRATSSFEDDVFAGLRWAANDIDSTEFLVGTIFDLDSSAKFVTVEGSRRIGDRWKITLDGRFFLGMPVYDPFYPNSRDDFFQIRLARYF